MNHIGELTEKWVTASYAGAANHDMYSHRMRVDLFLEFLGMTDTEFIETYKRSKDRVEWAKQMGLKVIAYYNNRVSQGFATNTVRAEVSSIKAIQSQSCLLLLL